jgi:imidazolonepropionase-like amidohydrolase
METSKTNLVKRYEPGKQARVELVNGRILDVINGRYFDAGTRVTLKGGKIESMPGLADEPTGITPDFTIDLQGKTILPGLYNTHLHLTNVGASMVASLSDMWRSKKYLEQQRAKNVVECLAHGVTHVKDAWWADLRESRVLRDRITRGEIPGPRILQAVVVGPAGSYLQEKVPLVLKLMGMPSVDPAEAFAGSVAFPIDATAQQIRDAVDIAIDERGADVIKIGDESLSQISGKPVPMMTIEQLTVLADQVIRRGVRSTMHHTSVESFWRGLKAGVSSLAHLPFDARLSQADVEAFKASGCFIDPTLSVLYFMKSWKMPSDQSNGHPVLNRLIDFRDKTYTFATIADEFYIPELRAAVMNGYKRCAGGRAKMMGVIDASRVLAWDTRVATAFDNFVLLYEQGVPMSTANDTVIPCAPAMVGLELLMFDHVLKGIPDGKQLSGAEAVRIATINSARSLGVDQEFGTIEAGKTADLVLLDGDPLEDFRLIGSRVDALFMDGKLVINNCGLEVESNEKA